MTLNELLPYLLPPLLGALIGYVTNYVAIRMLFRPLRPWRVFGIRVPMTPGIIPAKRGELATRMGEMVGSHLLTPDDVVRTLEQEAFRRELKIAVAEKLGQIFDRELGSVESLVPGEFQLRFAELIDVAGDKLAAIIVTYLRGPEFELRLKEFMNDKVGAALALDLEKCLNPGQYDAIRNHVDQLLSHYLTSDVLAESVGNFVDEKTGRWLRSDQPLRALLPEDLVALLLEQLEKEVPPLLEKFGGMLYDPDFRQRLIFKIRQGIEKFLDSLGGLAGLMSGFMDMDKVYDKIPETLDQISEEVARWLKEEKTRDQIAGMIRDRMEGFLERPLAEYVEKLPYEKVDGVRQFLRDRSIDLVQSRRTTETLLGLTERGVQIIRNRSFGNLLDSVLPANGRDQAVAHLEKRLLDMVRSESVSVGIHDVVRQQLRQLISQKSLGKLSSRLPADVNEELEEFIFLQLAEVLKKEVPVLVDALNIRQMVEAKVNSLDLLDVEGLLLGVMQEQFRYINLFGAVLGFLIGLLNLVVLHAGLF